MPYHHESDPVDPSPTGFGQGSDGAEKSNNGWREGGEAIGRERGIGRGIGIGMRKGKGRGRGREKQRLCRVGGCGGIETGG